MQGAERSSTNSENQAFLKDVSSSHTDFLPVSCFFIKRCELLMTHALDIKGIFLLIKQGSKPYQLTDSRQSALSLPCYFPDLGEEIQYLHFGLCFINPLKMKRRPLYLTLRLLMSYIYGAPILDISRSHKTTQHSRQDSSGRVISSSQTPLPDNTRHSQQTNIHAPGGIRTHDLSR